MPHKEHIENLDEYFIKKCFELAELGRGFVSPNPLVGAVIVREGGRIVGIGYHKKAGGPHAEIRALEDAGEFTKGATLYVNLEPCVHWGKTPPCVPEIIKAGIKRVVISNIDPNPLVNGKGVEELKKAGIEVKVGVLEEEGRKLNEVYFKNVEKKEPFVILKLAITLDGYIATKIGESKWISSFEARKFVHKIRGEVDGVVVGANTAIADDPILLPTLIAPAKMPVRFILDAQLRIPPKLKMFANKTKTIIVTVKNQKNQIKKKIFTSSNIEIWEVKEDKNGKVDLKDFLKKAYENNIRSILVEGGGELATSFLKEKLVDKIYLIYSLNILGSGIKMIGDLGILHLKDAFKFKITNYFKLGESVIVELRFAD